MLEAATLTALFIAGLIMFLAPCTLPLIPGYLALISGVSINQLSDKDKSPEVKSKVFYNGAAFVLGFTVVFVLFGVLIGLLGSTFTQARPWITIIAGALVTLFGFTMLHGKLPKALGWLVAFAGILTVAAHTPNNISFDLRSIVFLVITLSGFALLSFKSFNFLAISKQLSIPKHFKRGELGTSMLIGMAFATGWTPCAGPALGAALGLASSSATAATGAVQLFVFSAGLALPFLAVAFSADLAMKYFAKLNKALIIVYTIGGLFFIFLGILLITNRADLLSIWSFQFFEFLNLDFVINKL